MTEKTLVGNNTMQNKPQEDEKSSKLTKFTQFDVDGTGFEGAQFSVNQGKVVLAGENVLVPVKGYALTALYTKSGLKSLELKLYVDLEGIERIYEAFGIIMDVLRASSPNPYDKSEVTLVISESVLAKCKDIAATGNNPDDRLLELLKTKPELISFEDKYGCMGYGR